MTRKLYCYVDETGQDTQGELFIVSVVVTDWERNRIIQSCEAIEREIGKGRVKWIKTRYDRRLAYIKRILQAPIFRGKLYFAVFRDTRDYLGLTVWTIARAILAQVQEPYKVTVLVDGLPRSREREIGKRLRRLGIRTRKIRGVKKDENDALMRLADAICGFVRAAIEGQQEMKELFEGAVKVDILIDLGQKKNPLG